MKLWIISQEKNQNYDTYDSAVVAAETEEEARVINPAADEWSWTTPNHVTVQLIGTAKRNTKAGVVLASFNAG